MGKRKAAEVDVTVSTTSKRAKASSKGKAKKSKMTKLMKPHTISRNQWVDSTQAAVPHYGFKFMVDCLGQIPAGGRGITLKFSYKYNLALKGVL